jgi:catechol 2,3-dioxygenase-like lactoylglutathione lyase family enzyme
LSDLEDLAAINSRQQPVPGRINLVTLGVRDVAGQRRFYEALGWKTRSDGDDFAAFPLGGAVLALYSLELLAGEANLPVPKGEGFKGFTLAINVERIEQVDEAIGGAVGAGAKLLAEPVTREWGGRSGYFADPEGNVWEVAWLPNGAFDERGGLIWPF